MHIRANTEPKFLFKYLLIGVVCIIFSGWATYDLIFKYPKLLPPARAYDQLKADKSLDSAQVSDQYKAMARENGWSTDRPTKSEQTINNEVVWNYFFFAIGLAIGIPCIIWYLRTRGTWIETKENGLRASSGKELNFDQVTQFDKKKWEKKGIGVITYQSSDGPMKFVVDDLKYDRNNMDEIVRVLESNISHDLIINGEPESTSSNENQEEEVENAPAND